MPIERIVLERYINTIVFNVLNELGYCTEQLVSERENIGPGGGIRDLQNNIFFKGKEIPDVAKNLFGERYSFELEVFLRSIVNNKKTVWGVRTDHGAPAELKEGWTSVWKEHCKEKLYVLKKHTSIQDINLKKIVNDVVSEIKPEERYIKEILYQESFSILPENEHQNP